MVQAPSTLWKHDAGGVHQFAPMAKILWQLPTDMKITLELKEL